MKRTINELVRVDRYVVEVEVELIRDEGDWSPYYSPEDAKKLDSARLAPKNENLQEATKYGSVFELGPVLV
jgi:hypothetical protein